MPWIPVPGLLYAQVVKRYRRRRIVGVTHRVIFGVAETIESILGKRGWKMNTSFVERLNLDFRQHVAATGRRVNTLCKHEAGLRQQVTIFQAYHITGCKFFSVSTLSTFPIVTGKNGRAPQDHQKKAWP